MGWSSRDPAPPAIKAGKGAEDKEHAMSQPMDMDILRSRLPTNAPASPGAFLRVVENSKKASSR